MTADQIHPKLTPYQAHVRKKEATIDNIKMEGVADCGPALPPNAREGARLDLIKPPPFHLPPEKQNLIAKTRVKLKRDKGQLCAIWSMNTKLARFYQEIAE